MFHKTKRLQALNFTGRALEPQFSFQLWGNQVLQPNLRPSCTSCRAEEEGLHHRASNLNKWDVTKGWGQKHFQGKAWIQEVRGEVGLELQGLLLAMGRWESCGRTGFPAPRQALGWADRAELWPLWPSWGHGRGAAGTAPAGGSPHVLLAWFNKLMMWSQSACNTGGVEMGGLKIRIQSLLFCYVLEF